MYVPYASQVQDPEDRGGTLADCETVDTRLLNAAWSPGLSHEPAKNMSEETDETKFSR